MRLWDSQTPVDWRSAVEKPTPCIGTLFAKICFWERETFSIGCWKCLPGHIPGMLLKMRDGDIWNDVFLHVLYTCTQHTQVHTVTSNESVWSHCFWLLYKRTVVCHANSGRNTGLIIFLCILLLYKHTTHSLSCGILTIYQYAESPSHLGQSSFL